MIYGGKEKTMTARLTFLHALSPLHPGTGQGAGVIDLPIAREKATGLPYLPGSSLKGTLRAQFDPGSLECRQVFGPEATEVQADNNHASSVQFSDQRLLLLPVRSLAGTFAWVTSPYILGRFARDMKDARFALPPKLEAQKEIPHLQGETSSVVTGATSKVVVDTSVYLEDLKLEHIQTGESGIAEAWAEWIAEQVFPGDRYWQGMLKERFCIVHDDVLSFLLETATEIIARIKLKTEAKTVEESGLWYEEALPAETILSGIALATPTTAAGIKAERVFEILAQATGRTLQFGGKATVGRGLCRLLLVKGTEVSQKPGKESETDANA